jgi:hypothetical protein
MDTLKLNCSTTAALSERGYKKSSRLPMSFRRPAGLTIRWHL